MVCLVLALLAGGCETTTRRVTAVWAGLGGPNWRPPAEFHADIRTLGDRLTASGLRRFSELAEPPPAGTRITVRLAFEPGTRNFRVLRVENARSEKVIDAAREAIREAVEGAQLSPGFQPWLEKVDHVFFVL